MKLRSRRVAPNQTPVTVLYVQHYSDGGSITGLLELVRSLDRDRFRPIVCFRETSPFVPDFEAAGVPVVLLFDDTEGHVERVGTHVEADGAVQASWPLRREVRRAVRRDLPAVRRLLHVVREHGVDVIHANNDVVSNRDALVAGWLTRRPVVQHVRGMHRYDEDVALKLDRVLARTADHFVFMSEAIAECHRDQLPVRSGRSSVVDDPFDIATYQVDATPGGLADLALPDGARIVVNVGRIARWKGQDIFVRALAEVMVSTPSAFGLLVGAPTGEDGHVFERELRALVAELGIADRVMFVGARTDVAQVLSQAALVVHSAVEPEPFGRVVVEAMAAGRPVIATDAGGVTEIVATGVTGILVPPRDPGLLADAMVELLSDPVRASTMGALGQAAVAARFGTTAHARTVEALYDKALRRRQSTILFVQHYSDGGSVISLLELVRGLDRSRFAPVVCMRDSSPFVEAFEAAGVPVIVLSDSPAQAAEPTSYVHQPQEARSSRPLRRELRRTVRRDAPAVRRMIRLVREHRVDLIHANNEVVSNRDALVTAWLMRRPVVQHVRGMHRYEHDVSLRIDRLLARTVDQFIFISEAVAECHREQLPAKVGHFSVIDNPFDIGGYDVVATKDVIEGLAIPDGAHVAVNVGRIARWKGQDVFLRALAKVIDADPAVFGLLVGAPTGEDGDAFQDELERLASDLGIADRVLFAGARTDIAQVLARADLVVHSAVEPEPFGRVVVEAMAAGRPVIATAGGGVTEIIDPGVTGLLVPPKDSGAMAHAMMELLGDQDWATALGARGQAAASKRFLVGTHATAVQHLYDELLVARHGA